MISTNYALCVYDNDLPTHGLPGRNLLCASLSSIRREVWYADLGKLKLIRLAHLDCWNLDRGDPESEEPAYRTCVRRSMPKISDPHPFSLPMIPKPAARITWRARHICAGARRPFLFSSKIIAFVRTAALSSHPEIGVVLLRMR